MTSTMGQDRSEGALPLPPLPGMTVLAPGRRPG